MSGTYFILSDKNTTTTGGGSGLTQAQVQALIDVLDADLQPQITSNDTDIAQLFTYAITFESVSKNLRSWDNVLAYSGRELSSVTYSNGGLTIVKTLNYTSKQLTSIVLSGDTPSGINLTKTLTYTGKDLTGISYS